MRPGSLGSKVCGFGFSTFGLEEYGIYLVRQISEIAQSLTSEWSRQANSYFYIAIQAIDDILYLEGQ